MPSTYAHRRFGANVLDHLPRRCGKAGGAPGAVRYRPARAGPAVLLPCGKVHHGRRAGQRHARRAGRTFFDRARRVVHEEADREAALAYALGFVCHFALDSTCHPFVEQFTRESGVTHCEIETEFDNMLLRRDGYDPLTFFTASHIHPSAATPGSLRRFTRRFRSRPRWNP